MPNDFRNPTNTPAGAHRQPVPSRINGYEFPSIEGTAVTSTQAAVGVELAVRDLQRALADYQKAQAHLMWALAVQQCAIRREGK